MIEEIDWDQETYGSIGYPHAFTNNSIGTALSGDQQSKQFDNLPLRAETQTIIDNRLVYGNYVDGFDLAEVDTVAFEPVHSERPDDFKTYEIQALPSTSPAPGEYFQKGQNKNVGFTIDASSLTSNIEEGSFCFIQLYAEPKEQLSRIQRQGNWISSVSLRWVRTSTMQACRRTESERMKTTSQPHLHPSKSSFLCVSGR